jgi:hypothetical protein
VKKTFEYGNDISMALKNLLPADKDVWRVSLKMSKADDQITKDQENKKYEMDFKLDYEEYRTRMKIYDNNLTKAYALIWERCTKGMKHKIEARMEFTKNIENNPIELLKAIREHSQNYQENRYSMSIVLDSLRGLLATKQKEGETLQDWTKRFRKVLESHMGGPIVIDNITKAMPEYVKYEISSVEKCHNKTYESFLAYLYIENADRTKYSSILVGLNTQQLLGNNQYPKTVTEANNVLSNHKLDTPNKSKKVHDKFKNKYKKSNTKEKEDSNETKINLSFAQLEGKCYCCGRVGHKSPQCRLKDCP